MFCKHDWKVLSEKMTESKLQHAIKLGFQKLKSGNSSDLERLFIQVFSCSKCGKLKRYVEIC